MEEPVLNAIVTLRNEVSPWLMILQVVPDGWELPDYVPGHFTSLGLPGSATRYALAEPEVSPVDLGKLIKRVYCIASSPANREFLEFYVALVPGGTTLLPRIVGERSANEIIFSAKPISAAKALEWGIFNRVCSAKDLMPTVMAVAEGIIENAPLAVVQAKKAIHEGIQMDQRTALRFEYAAYNQLTNTQDRVEGTNAWNEKRKPVFKGC